MSESRNKEIDRRTKWGFCSLQGTLTQSGTTDSNVVSGLGTVSNAMKKKKASLNTGHSSDSAAARDLLQVVTCQRFDVSPVVLWRQSRDAKWTLSVCMAVGTSGVGTVPLKPPRVLGQKNIKMKKKSRNVI